MDLPRQIRSGDPYPLRGLVAFGLNHRMFPGSASFLEAIQKLDFICDVDLFATDSARYADIVLPACSSVERSELRCYPEKYVALSQPAIAPLGESRSDTDIVFELARRLGLDDPLLNPTPDGVVGAGRGLRRRPGLDPRAERHDRGAAQGASRRHAGARPAARAWSASTWTRASPRPPARWSSPRRCLPKHGARLGTEALPTYGAPRHSPEASPDLAAEYPFVLNTGSRLPMFVHSRTYRLPWTRSLRPQPAADLNPADAKRLGIGQGDEIELATPVGRHPRAGQPDGARPAGRGAHVPRRSRSRREPAARPRLPRPDLRLPRFQGAAVRGAQGRAEATAARAGARRDPGAHRGSGVGIAEGRAGEPRVLPRRRALHRLLRLRRRLHGPERPRGAATNRPPGARCSRSRPAPSPTPTCATCRSPACTARTLPACWPAPAGPSAARPARRSSGSTPSSASAATAARSPAPSGCRASAPTARCPSAICAASGSRPAWSRLACASAPRARCGRAAPTCSVQSVARRAAERLAGGS